jgi:hypothetical protein
MSMSRRLAVVVVAALVGGGVATLSTGSAQAAALAAVLVRTVDTGAWATPSPDPAGITYDAANNRLVLSDSEVDEMPLYQGRNVFFSTLDGQQTAGNTGWTTVPWSNEPAGISYQTAGHFLVSDDDQDKVFVVDTGADGVWTPEDGVPPSFTTRPLNGDPEDVTMDMDATTNGHVLIIDGHNTDVYDYGPGADGTFNGVPPVGDDTRVAYDVGQYGALDPEGIEYYPGRNTILVLDSGSKAVYELDRQGRLLNVVSIAAGGPKSAAGITLAPPSDGSAGDPHLYIVDRGVDNDTNPAENDGRFYEMAVDLPDPGDSTNRAPQVSAGPDLSVSQSASATLAGSVSDDGLPNPPGAVTVTWTKVSGPGAVTFANPNAASTTATFGVVGDYVLRLTAGDGDMQARDDVSVTVTEAVPGGGVALDVPVAAGTDDAEERSASVSTSGTDLEMVVDGTTVQTVGLRFAGVTVPAGATITKAYVQFSTDEAATLTTNLTVAGQAADNPPGFTTVSKNISSRSRTAATVAWTPTAWPTAGARGVDQQTPDLAPIVQEIVSRPGWADGNALVVVVTGSGTRTASASERGAAKAPVLHLEYGSAPSPGPTNVAPTVSAGPDVAVTLPGEASLAGSVSDDGLPNPPGAVTAAWTTVSGPGPVVFADAAAASTTATFSAAGDYVLRLTGDDGALRAADEVTVTVFDDGTEPTNAPPAVGAGNDVSVTLPGSASLAGSVSDDGLPNPPGAVTAAWSMVSGPGTVSFADAAAAATTATFSAAGDYVLRLTGDDGALQTADEVTVTVGSGSSGGGGTPGTLDVPVRVSADDAEERTSTGAVSLTSGDLNLGHDGTRAQTVAMRFTGVTLPPGATITNAWVQFQVDEASTATASLTVAGEAADNAGAFTTTARNISSRSRTTATVGWTPAQWPTLAARAADQQTPNLAAVVQEIVGRPGWASGNALVLTVTGTGTRVAESFDGGAPRAPVLHIEYTV